MGLRRLRLCGNGAEPRHEPSKARLISETQGACRRLGSSTYLNDANHVPPGHHGGLCVCFQSAAQCNAAALIRSRSARRRASGRRASGLGEAEKQMRRRSCATEGRYHQVCHTRRLRMTDKPLLQNHPLFRCRAPVSPQYYKWWMGSRNGLSEITYRTSRASSRGR